MCIYIYIYIYICTQLHQYCFTETEVPWSADGTPPPGVNPNFVVDPMKAGSLSIYLYDDDDDYQFLLLFYYCY